jgi:sporulation protein YlmC with PRC-barrel domain
MGKGEGSVSKIHITAAAVALALAAATPAAYAQTSTTHETRAAAANTVTAAGIQPDEMRASKIIGSAVYDVQNRKIGSVQDLVLDKGGKIDVVVVDSARSSEWEERTARSRSTTSRPTITA